MHSMLRFAFILLTTVSFFASCKKKQEEGEVTRRDELLGTWRRNLRANDYNSNFIIDPAEIKQAPATDTLLLTLVPDATYTRTQLYKGQSFPEYGTWHLQRNDEELVLQPTTSTSRIDTFRFDSVSQAYFRYHTAYPGSVWAWEAYERPN